MRLIDFQNNALATNERGTRAGSRTAAIYGLVGEVGGIASALKKRIIYPQKGDENFRHELCEELGDALWYLSVVAAQYDLKLDRIARENVSKNFSRMPEPKARVALGGHMTFSRYHRLAKATNVTGKSDHITLGLIRNVGELVLQFRRHDTLLRRYAFTENRSIKKSKRGISDKIGNVFWYLTMLAESHHLTMDNVAKFNLEKSKRLQEIGEIVIHDIENDEDERFPRTIQIDFSEREVLGSKKVLLKVNGVIIGDRLNDNSYSPDDYRFHDAFHVAYMAVLGWSPVMRDLLKRKRKSNPNVDENEDGARARIIEEAISLYVFNMAKHRFNYFQGAEHVDFNILKTIMNLCSELEVKKCTAKQWQKAVLTGYQIWHQLTEHRGGSVFVDLDKAEVDFFPPGQVNRFV